MLLKLSYKYWLMPAENENTALLLILASWQLMTVAEDYLLCRASIFLSTYNHLVHQYFLLSLLNILIVNHCNKIAIHFLLPFSHTISHILSSP